MVALVAAPLDVSCLRSMALQLFFVASAVFGDVGLSLSWQVQHFVKIFDFVKFWEIAGTRNVVFPIQNASPR